jgi:hypothetical protein
MKKKEILEWLVRNLESWPKRRSLAPNVSDFRWCKNNDSLFLFDVHSTGNIEDLTIYKCEWEHALAVKLNMTILNQGE